MASTTIARALQSGGFFNPAFDRPPLPSKSPRAPSFQDKAQTIEAVLADAQAVLGALPDLHSPAIRDGLNLIHDRLFDEELNANAVYEVYPGSGFRLQFQDAFGAGVRQYIEDARLLVAARLLSYPDLEVYLIADAVGYTHYETFSRAFKRRLDCSPTVYRQHLIGDDGRPMPLKIPADFAEDAA